MMRGRFNGCGCCKWRCCGMRICILAALAFVLVLVIAYWDKVCAVQLALHPSSSLFSFKSSPDTLSQCSPESWADDCVLIEKKDGGANDENVRDVVNKLFGEDSLFGKIDEVNDDSSVEKVTGHESSKDDNGFDEDGDVDLPGGNPSNAKSSDLPAKMDLVEGSSEFDNGDYLQEKHWDVLHNNSIHQIAEVPSNILHREVAVANDDWKGNDVVGRKNKLKSAVRSPIVSLRHKLAKLAAYQPRGSTDPADVNEWLELLESDGRSRNDVEMAREQARRLERISNVCGSSSQDFVGKKRVLEEMKWHELDHLIVDDNRGIIYCYVPKVACTNWKRLMIVLSGSATNNGKPYTEPLEVPSLVAHLPSSHHTLARQWRLHGPSFVRHKLATYSKFLFVREPFARLVSAFHSKFAVENEAFYHRFAIPMLQLYQGVVEPAASAVDALSDKMGNGKSRLQFSSFVRYLLDPKTEKRKPLNEHWRQVHRLCHPCQISYDFVGHLEKQTEETSYLLRMLGVPQSLHLPPAFHNKTDLHLVERSFSGVPLALRRQLYQLYATDYALFGYPSPSQLLED
uniref:carbohydrate sulfotransferase 12 isoform X1 n=1 Tax=Myxine glutinosa TaxID=7769 RepID=UPI00358E9680